MISESELAVRRLAQARLDALGLVNMEHAEVMDKIAKALGIYVGHEAWWDIPRKAQLLRIMDRIRTLKEKA